MAASLSSLLTIQKLRLPLWRSSRYTTIAQSYISDTSKSILTHPAEAKTWP